MNGIEKFFAFLFLLLLVGIVMFMTFVPVPEASRQVILIVIGGLMTTAAQALPKLFGVKDQEKEEMRVRLKKLENQYELMEKHYGELMRALLEKERQTTTGKAY